MLEQAYKAPSTQPTCRNPCVMSASISLQLSLHTLLLLFTVSFLFGRYLGHLWSAIKGLISLVLCLGVLTALLVWLQPELKGQLLGVLWDHRHIFNFTSNSTWLASLWERSGNTAWPWA